MHLVRRNGHGYSSWNSDKARKMHKEAFTWRFEYNGCMLDTSYRDVELECGSSLLSYIYDKYLAMFFTFQCYLWCCGGCLCSFTWPSCWSIAIECIVCEKSDVFLPSHGRNMGQQESYKGWFCSEPLHNLSMKLDDFMDSVGLYVLVHLRQTNT
ncbi:uncharacterized protein LOC110024010 isoform X3 [Phalaenopsis equestris]|uniref:uncharacterized protein LOC110024010 isoform X3 n=1 Tax=Phalaenopsis equestris TaxID=78828 RepID=UPI0009E265C8|nr:uncharacterized protein LOC110024010 isoform X3 [Phalaenopsis equestris]